MRQRPPGRDFCRERPSGAACGGRLRSPGYNAPVKFRHALLTLCAALALGPLPGRGAEDVATVLGESISRDGIAAAAGEPAALGRLYDLVWRRAARHYVKQNGLDATAEEVLAARPSMVIAPGEVDFTPYWKRPIPPSYFPD